jgi:hypothetical protein
MPLAHQVRLEFTLLCRVVQISCDFVWLTYQCRNFPVLLMPLQPLYADGISKRINTYQHSESFWRLGQTADFEVEPGGIRQQSDSPIAP